MYTLDGLAGDIQALHQMIVELQADRDRLTTRINDLESEVSRLRSFQHTHQPRETND